MSSRWRPQSLRLTMLKKVVHGDQWWNATLMTLLASHMIILTAIELSHIHFDWRFFSYAILNLCRLLFLQGLYRSWNSRNFKILLQSPGNSLFFPTNFLKNPIISPHFSGETLEWATWVEIKLFSNICTEISVFWFQKIIYSYPCTNPVIIGLFLLRMVYFIQHFLVRTELS